MAKRYTAAEWARIQSRLPEEDRVPYSESPDAPTPQQLAATTLPTVFAATSRARTSSNAASGAIGNAQAALGDYYANQAAATAAAAKALLSTSTTATTAAVTPTTATAATVTATTATTPTVTPTTATTPTVTPTTATTNPVVATTATGAIVATTATSATASKSIVGTYIDPVTGDVYSIFSDNTRELIARGTKAADAAAAAAAQAAAAQAAAAAAAEAKRAAGQSAYDLLRSQFELYGLGDLIEPLKDLISEGVSAAEMALKLRNDPKYNKAYKMRFAANDQRIAKGLRALSEAEYIGLEDQYQNIMRNYGLPESYYARGAMGRQEGFEKFIAGDVSAAELEDRIQTAQNRVINAAPEVSRALRQFYPGITNGDILAYALDPEKALTDIRRKVTAAEIGAGAMQAGLATDVSRAEELGAFGVTGERARAGYQTVADILPTAQKLSDIYRKQGLGAYNQATAEQEVFGITGAAESGRKRRKLSELEQASFSGQAGITGGALGRERAGQF